MMHKYIRHTVFLLAVLMFCAVWCFAIHEWFLAFLGTAGTAFTLAVLYYLYDTIVLKKQREAHRREMREEYLERDKRMIREELFRSYDFMSAEEKW